MNTLVELRDLALRLAPAEGFHTTALDRVTLVRGDAPSAPTPVLYAPRLCVGIQGQKELAIGETILGYGPGDELVASVELPVTGRIVTASPDMPYLAFMMDFDPVELAGLHLEVPVSDDAEPAFATGPATPELLDAVVRALRMIEHPSELPVLGPLVRRELLFRVLTGRSGPMLRRLTLHEGHAAQVGRALAWLRTHYAEPLRVETLARQVGMSVTSFHRHFKAMTAMSPLQYQKQLRLQEARHLLLGDVLDIASVSARVGYESATQFTREYSRLFGAPPRRDAERLRAALMGT